MRIRTEVTHKFGKTTKHFNENTRTRGQLKSRYSHRRHSRCPNSVTSNPTKKSKGRAADTTAKAMLTRSHHLDAPPSTFSPPSTALATPTQFKTFQIWLKYQLPDSSLPPNPSPKSPTFLDPPIMPHPPLKAVTLTHVRYQRGDRFGHFLAWVSLVPVFISLGGFVSHFIFRRELQGMCFALGLLISQFINEVIKKSVQQARPETCALLEMCDSHGWPSSHSQYMFFFAVYFTLLSYKGIVLLTGKYRWIASFAWWLLAVLTMHSRVYLGYHTVAQVFAGATLGIILGAVWFWVVNSVLFRYFPVIEESEFGRWFYIKDTSHIHNVLEFEYEKARAARKDMNCKSD